MALKPEYGELKLGVRKVFSLSGLKLNARLIGKSMGFVTDEHKVTIYLPTKEEMNKNAAFEERAYSPCSWTHARLRSGKVVEKVSGYEVNWASIFVQAAVGDFSLFHDANGLISPKEFAELEHAENRKGERLRKLREELVF